MRRCRWIFLSVYRFEHKVTESIRINFETSRVDASCADGLMRFRSPPSGVVSTPLTATMTCLLSIHSNELILCASFATAVIVPSSSYVVVICQEYTPSDR